MPARLRTLALVILVLPRLAAAQQPAPVAVAFRDNAHTIAKNLIAAADDMPAAKFSFKPTPAQMSFADIVGHLSEGNDFLCSSIGGMKAPTRAPVTATAGKEAQMTRLRDTFKFCDDALAKLDDSKLGEELPLFGGKKMTRAAIMTLTTGDWADHYSQAAIYLRLNGVIPPTARKATP